MADSKISGLSEETSPASTDWLEVEPNAGGTSEKVQIGNLGVGGGQPMLPLEQSWGLPGTTQVNAPSGTSFLLVAGSWYMWPMVVTEAITVTDAGMRIATADAAMSVRASIYSVGDADWDGTKTLVSGGDLGEIDVGSTGESSVTGLSVSLAPGRYWFAIQSEGAPTISFYRNAGGVQVYAMPDLGGQTFPASVFKTGSYGVAPATLPTPLTWLTGTTANGVHERLLALLKWTVD